MDKTMPMYTQRIQTVLSPKQHEMLVAIARQQSKPLSVLVREAIEKAYFEEAERERRRAALADLLALDVPVADWTEMEAEIIAGGLA